MKKPRDATPQQFDIHWEDKYAEPQVKPNPAYPNGIDLDGSRGAEIACKVALPYPAKRIGVYVVRCKLCGYSIGVTTAGRPDDPRSITVACKLDPL
jgi:hypothetical protein